MTEALVFWFTGLSGAGKSTVALGAQARLRSGGWRVSIVDGDAVRERLHGHLGFSEADIKTNNLLIAELCADRRTDYDVILVPIISPFTASRDAARESLGDHFFEIHIAADLDTVSTRDVKGLYSRARKNEITDLIGFSPGSVYETPAAPDLTLDTAAQPPETSISVLYEFIARQLRDAAKRKPGRA